MKFEILRDSIQITPETAQDEAFIVDTLGLKKTGDSIRLVRYAPYGMEYVLACLEASKEEAVEIAVRHIDDLGRVVIPKVVREILNIQVGDAVKIFVRSDEITIRKTDE